MTEGNPLGVTRAAWALAAGLAALGALSAASCGGDDTPASSGPRAPPGLSILELRSVGGPTWKPGDEACVEIGRDPNATIAVVLAVSDFTFRPPGACGSARQCGTALLRVDPSGDGELLRVEAAQATLSAPFQGIPEGSHTFHVELILKTGEPVFDKDAGQTLYSEVTLDVKAPGGCGGSVSDAGTDAAGDAGSDAPSDASDATVEDVSTSDAAEDAASDATLDVPVVVDAPLDVGLDVLGD